MSEIYCRALDRIAFVLQVINVFKVGPVVMLRIRCECGGIHDVPANKEQEVNG